MPSITPHVSQATPLHTIAEMSTGSSDSSFSSGFSSMVSVRLANGACNVEVESATESVVSTGWCQRVRDLFSNAGSRLHSLGNSFTTRQAMTTATIVCAGGAALTAGGIVSALAIGSAAAASGMATTSESSYGCWTQLKGKTTCTFIGENGTYIGNATATSTQIGTFNTTDPVASVNVTADGLSASRNITGGETCFIAYKGGSADSESKVLKLIGRNDTGISCSDLVGRDYNPQVTVNATLVNKAKDDSVSVKCFDASGTTKETKSVNNNSDLKLKDPKLPYTCQVKETNGTKYMGDIEVDFTKTQSDNPVCIHVKDKSSDTTVRYDLPKNNCTSSPKS